MRIFAPCMHGSFTKSLDQLCDYLNYQLLLPDLTFQLVIKYGVKYANNKGFQNAHVISYQELLHNPPDILFLPCYEQESDIIQIWNKIKFNKKTKLVHFAGNENVPYKYDRISNIICSDIKTYKQAVSEKKNSLHYFPWIPFKMFPFHGVNSNNIINTYIMNYARGFPTAYKLWEEVAFTDYNRKYNLIEVQKRSNLPILMQRSSATLHIKPSEGFGYAIIESLSSGRPVIMYRHYIKDQTFLNWVIEGQNAIVFENHSDYLDKIEEFFNNHEYRFQLQNRSAEIIREKINNHEQAEKFKIFMESLI